MKLRTIVIFLALCLALSAQTYNLEELVSHGVAHATAIRQEMLDQLTSESSLRSSYWNFLPSASVSYGYSNGKNFSDSHSSGLSVSKTISLHDSDWYEVRRQYIYRSIAEMSLEDLRKQIAYNVVSQYLDIIEAQRAYEIMEAQLAIETSTHEQTRILYDADKRSLLDLKQSEINLIDARISLEDQEINLTQLRQNLFSLLCLNDEGYPLVDPQLDIDPLDMAWMKPLSLRMAEEQIDADKISLRESSMRFFPNVSLSASWGYSAGGRKFDDAFDDYEDDYSVGLNISYDLFNILTRGESHRRSKWALRRSILGLEDSARDSRLEFDQKLSEWNHLHNMHGLYEQRLDLAEDNYEMAQEKYRLGMMNFLDAEQVRIDYFQAQIAVNSSRFKLLRRREELNLLLSRKILGKW